MRGQRRGITGSSGRREAWRTMVLGVQLQNVIRSHLGLGVARLGRVRSGPRGAMLASMDGIVTRQSHRYACLCLLLSSCAGSLPVAQKAEDSPGAGIVVAALPPPALPEEIPP